MTTYNIEQNLDTLTAMTSNLTPYLYEDELFGHLGSNLPKLTVGGLLLRLHQLRHLSPHLSDNQQQRLHDALMNFEAAQSDWSLHFEQKVLREIESRLGAIKWYLDDATKDLRGAQGGWRNEIEKRTIIAHLVDEAIDLEILTDDLKASLSEIDTRLHGIHQDGEFAWDERLADAYPHAKFWWLYGDVRRPDDDK